LFCRDDGSKAGSILLPAATSGSKSNDTVAAKILGAAEFHLKESGFQ
jgi:hypothetical protein